MIKRGQATGYQGYVQRILCLSCRTLLGREVEVSEI